ncbi:MULTISPECIES: fluoride efflux transporter CrcB [unclassified Granulicatella]|uniref:fluoride efflux transporter CrcB n=1 Tax=unclassified Granulicatella TaxID=2630493 RepID=UPI0010743DA7|nr:MULTISPECIES: fluoride efflux transporter CrcB [unclassified Granulicatella]MBF0780178.1 fluoride efflux transporter CrcB [Granulicatella sp. 19428wC4_WM01]TFU95729.1 fluoride efflux transporter CrcB [Granulicatella sp. WM01]
MKHILFVGSGAFVGAILRYGMTLIPIAYMTSFMKTMLINIIGAFLLSIITRFIEKNMLTQEMFLLLGTGVCGGFTTFSTFSLEIIQLIDDRHYIIAFLYAILSVVLSLFAIILGRIILQ